MRVWIATIAWAACLSTASVGCSPPSADRPSIVLVSIDTLRADHLSSYGYERATSPHLDALAADGILFERAYAHVPFTLPSHASMLTSLLPGAHGVTRDARISDHAPMLPELLQQAGYRTFGYYAQVWLADKFGFARGFERYESVANGQEELAAAEALIDELAAAPDPAPFFLFFHMRDVHSRPVRRVGFPLYDSPPEFRDAFLPHPELAIRYRPRDVWDNQVALTDPELENLVARYDGGILYADSILQRLFAKLESAGMFDETLIVVTSDHGESLGHRGDFGSHGATWEEGLRVPLIVKLPDSHPDRERLRGVRLPYPVQSIDIAPTALRIAGVEAPASFQGRELFDGSERDVLAHSEQVSVLIRGTRKLRRDPQREPAFALYDLAEDPGEQNPRGEGPPGTLDTLADRMGELVREEQERYQAIADRQAHEVDEVELSNDERQQLEALGYVVD